MKNHQRDQFARDGFYVFENILDPPLLDRLCSFSDEMLARQEPEHFEMNRATGSMVLIDWSMVYEHSILAELLAHPAALSALGQLGFDDPKFGHGRIICKPPHSPPLFWHEDCRFWNDPVSHTTQPIASFLMYYLTDTTPQNGCLRVIPGSHLKRHPLHDKISPVHTDELTSFADPDDPGFSRVDDELDVPVKAGDVVIGYDRMLHASHGNQTDERRTVLTMWYYPDFVDLPERTQATVALAEARNRPARAAPGELQALMEPLGLAYDGDAGPIELERKPGPDLR